MQLLCFVSLSPPISTYLSHLDSLRPPGPQSHNPHLHLLSGARARVRRLLFPSVLLLSVVYIPGSLTCKSHWASGRIRPSILRHSPFSNLHAHARGPRARKGKPAARCTKHPQASRQPTGYRSASASQNARRMARVATYHHSVFSMQYSMPNGRPTTCTLEAKILCFRSPDLPGP
ncbi:hypothetical protein OH76DRAFT_437784 [Lentinus brumalis]|uniref:Uncharacterized protein n=1 Tax=Lentinus brumalis TaxID=2498619 RepID=A0A371DDZ3_9APHY|nr:hypothetical protein OH76DRAFT_437784 [Polyporus brumalis]